MQAIGVLDDPHPGRAVVLVCEIDTVDRLRPFKGSDLLPVLTVGADLNSRASGSPHVAALAVLNDDTRELGVVLKAHGDERLAIACVTRASILSQDAPVMFGGIPPIPASRNMQEPPFG